LGGARAPATNPWRGGPQVFGRKRRHGGQAGGAISPHGLGGGRAVVGHALKASQSRLTNPRLDREISRNGPGPFSGISGCHQLVLMGDERGGADG